MKKLLSVSDTANLLNVKVSTLYAWVHRKKIPFVKTGGKLGFIEDQINDFIMSNNYIPES